MLDIVKGNNVFIQAGYRTFKGEVIRIIGDTALLKMKCPEWNIHNPGFSCSRMVKLEDIKGVEF